MRPSASSATASPSSCRTAGISSIWLRPSRAAREEGKRSIGSLDSKERRSCSAPTPTPFSRPPLPARPAVTFSSRARGLFSLSRSTRNAPALGRGLSGGRAGAEPPQLRLRVTASDNGILAYQAGGAGGISQLVWLDRSGKQLDVLGPPADYLRPRLSRDGRRVAVDVRDPQTGHSDIWIYDLARRVSTRFTFEPADNVFPIWSPDDSRIVFSRTGRAKGICIRRSRPERETTRLLGPGEREGSHRLVFRRPVPRLPDDQTPDEDGLDLGIYSVAEKKAFAFLSTPAAEVNGRFSPDGRWIAYQSDESGRWRCTSALPGPRREMADLAGAEGSLSGIATGRRSSTCLPTTS